MPEMIKFCIFLNFLEIFIILNLFLSDRFSFFADKWFPEWLNWPIKGVIISTKDDSFPLYPRIIPIFKFLSDFFTFQVNVYDLRIPARSVGDLTVRGRLDLDLE